MNTKRYLSIFTKLSVCMVLIMGTMSCKKSSDTATTPSNSVFAGILNSLQVVGAGTGGSNVPVTYTGGAVVSLVFNPNTNNLNYTVQWSFPQTDIPTYAAFYIGNAGSNGTVLGTPIINYTPGGAGSAPNAVQTTPVTGTINLTASQATTFLANGVYLQFKSTTYTNGAVRIQILPVSNAAAFYAPMFPTSGSAADYSQGTIAGTYSLDTKKLSFSAAWGLANYSTGSLAADSVSGGTFNGPLPTPTSTSVQPVILTVPSAVIPPTKSLAVQGLNTYTTAALTTQQETDFLASKWYFVINTVTKYTGGTAGSTTLRGNIAVQQ